MILIADNTERKMRNITKNALFEMCIPCAVVHTDRIDAYLPSGVIVVTERYLMSDVKYMSEMHRRSPILLYDEKSSLLDFALAAYGEYCMKNTGPGFPLSIGEDSISIRGVAIPMTKTQIRIIRMLLISSDWESGERLALYCLKKRRTPNIKSIAVHVCNINNKVKRVIGINLILKRRYSGYALCYSKVK